MGIRERLAALRAMRQRESDPSADETIHPDTWLQHEEHICYVRTIRYDEALYQRRDLPHVDKQVLVIGKIWGFPDLVEPPVSRRQDIARLPKFSYSELDRWTILLSDGWCRPDDGISSETYIRSLCSLGLVTISRRQNWRDILRQGLGLSQRELPRVTELTRFRELFPDHAEVFSTDALGYYRVFSIMVPSGRIAVDYMQAAFIGLRSAVQDQEADLDMPEEYRIRLVRSLAANSPGISVRRLARAFSVPIRAVGGA